MYLIWLSMFRGGGLWGNDGNCANPQLRSIQDTLNSQATNGLVMDAIKSNASALGDVSTKLGCSTGQITSAINGVKDSITNQGWANQLANCQQTNTIERNFAQTNYNIAEQSCAIKQTTKDNTAAIIAKLDSIEDSRKDREINALTAALASANAKAERQAELAPIVSQLNAIKCAQPATVTLPYSCATAVPTSMVYNTLGLNAYNGTGNWG